MKNCFWIIKKLQQIKLNIMQKVKEMIETAPSKKEAMNMLETWKLFGGLNDSLYKKGREYIQKV